MKHILLTAGLLFSLCLSAQEQLGLRLENYAGVNSLSINPAGNLTNPLGWDVNLFALGSFVENNYTFIRETNLLDLLRNGRDAEFIQAKDLEGATPSNTFVVDYFDDGKERYAFVNSFITGPSLALKVNEQHSLGVFTNFRIMGGAKDVSEKFSYYNYDSRPYFDPFEVPPFHGVLMSWSEIGVNYAFKKPVSDGFLGLGVNLKFLTGYEAGFIENLSPWVHTKLPDDHITIGGANGRFGLTTSSLNGDGLQRKANGRGFGLDLGVIRVFQESEEGYKLKIGASLLDLGFIRFKDNAELHRIKNSETFELVLEDYDMQFEDAEDLIDVIRLFSEDALGDSLASLQGNEFKLALPSAISIQADYSFSENMFLNAFFLQDFSLGQIGPPRGSLLALTPRYEHRWYSISLPLSLYNWQDFQVGFAARLGFLVLGSDNLGSLLGRSDFTGTDFYVALKINPFGSNGGVFSGFGAGGGRKYGRKGKVKCYDF